MEAAGAEALRLEWWDADPVFSKAVLAGLAFAVSAALGGLLVKSPCESREPGRARVQSGAPRAR
jgi:hypothetical protein